jgi:type I restriction enzyme R subunit
LLKADKQRSIEVFGRYIHAYKFDETVKHGVVLDLRYEARDIDRRLTSPAKIEQWFEARPAGRWSVARATTTSAGGTACGWCSVRVPAVWWSTAER